VTDQRLFTTGLIDDPYPTYHRLRAAAPVYLDPDSGELLVTRYADVAAALKHPLLSNRRVAETGLPLPGYLQWAMRPVTRILSRGMLFSDPPDHTRLRSLANRAFTPRVVEGMRSRIQQIADDLLDAVAGHRPVDLIESYAAWLPVIVIAEMLGADVRDRDRFRLWSDDAVSFVGGSTHPDGVVLLRAARGMFSLRRYFGKLVRRRRKDGPGDDLLGALIDAEERGDALTEDELLANAVLLLAAGHETTTSLIGNGLLALLRHPEQTALLRREPDLIGSAVEEFLRFDSPVQWSARVALEEVEIGGCRIPAGRSVTLGIGAANRDPDQFPDPDRLDLRRAENRHLAFGQGIHFCLGAALARLEGQVAINTLLLRFPHMQLADERPQWRDNFTLRGLKSLWVSLH
jgi:cytochrome P450